MKGITVLMLVMIIFLSIASFGLFQVVGELTADNILLEERVESLELVGNAILFKKVELMESNIEVLTQQNEMIIAEMQGMGEYINGMTNYINENFAVTFEVLNTIYTEVFGTPQ